MKWSYKSRTSSLYYLFIVCVFLLSYNYMKEHLKSNGANSQSRLMSMYVGLVDVFGQMIFIKVKRKILRVDFRYLTCPKLCKTEKYFD